MLRDLRLALRNLAKRPGFAAAAVLTLAVGIGANTAIFSVVSGVLLQPLPFPEPERLSFITREGDVSIPDAIDWRRESRSFAAISLFLRGWAFDLSGDGDPERLRGSVVEPEFFDVLKTPPLLGRVLTAEDNRVGGARVAVLSEGFWKRRFGGDPARAGPQDHAVGQPHRGRGRDAAPLRLPERRGGPLGAGGGGDALGHGGAGHEQLRRHRATATGRRRWPPPATRSWRISTRLAEEYPKTNAGKIVEPLPMLEFMTGTGGAVALGPAGRGRPAGPARHREPLEPAPRPLHGAAGRVRGAAGPGRGPRAHPAASPGRRPGPRRSSAEPLACSLAAWSKDLLLLVAPDTLPRTENVGRGPARAAASPSS